MAETILTPNEGIESVENQATSVDPGYLVKDNFLSEFLTDAEKSVVRYNLGVLAAEDVYSKEEVEPVVIDLVRRRIAEHLDSVDHITPEYIAELLSEYVRLDGSTPFTAPQAGVTPVANHDLTTKLYVDQLIQNCLKSADKTAILNQVATTLLEYAKSDTVYPKDKVYNKDEVDRTNSKFVKIDGSTPFTTPQSGRTPQISSHLATKGYVDSVLDTHKQDIDPHGFTEKLSNKLKKYALSANVYDKTQTYSRGQIDYIIDKLVEEAVQEALQLHEGLDDPHGIIDKVKSLGYMLPDGSTPFTGPQRGVAAVNDSDLVTLKQVEDKVSAVSQTISEIPEPVWKTSGPVESTVGHVDDNTMLSDTLTLQEVCDAIFYGKGICLEVPEFVIITEKCPVTMCIHGSTGVIDRAELLQDGVVIATLYGEDFRDGCVTIESDALFSDAEFTFKVYYTNDSIHEETKIVKCYLPVFVGLLPKWKSGNTVTMEYLIESCKEDENNRFLNYGKDLETFSFKYSFQDAGLRHPYVVLPADYPDLESMVTKSQSFGADAFNVIDMIPMSIPGVGRDIIYKMYIYKLALSSLNQEVTFNFE